MDILDDMGVSKLSAKVFFLKWTTPLSHHIVSKLEAYLLVYGVWLLILFLSIIDLHLCLFFHPITWPTW